MSQVRLFKITGELRKGGDKLPFTKNIKAVKKEDALQHLYSDMGSRHKARRFEITVKQIEELPEPEAVWWLAPKSSWPLPET
jgi:large subunit ribosomal protein LX